jgi:hypothetical protein
MDVTSWLLAAGAGVIAAAAGAAGLAWIAG